MELTDSAWLRHAQRYLRAALGSVHGVGKIQAGLSDFYPVSQDNCVL